MWYYFLSGSKKIFITSPTKSEKRFQSCRCRVFQQWQKCYFSHLRHTQRWRKEWFLSLHELMKGKKIPPKVRQQNTRFRHLRVGQRRPNSQFVTLGHTQKRWKKWSLSLEDRPKVIKLFCHRRFKIFPSQCEFEFCCLGPNVTWQNHFTLGLIWGDRGEKNSWEIREIYKIR